MPRVTWILGLAPLVLACRGTVPRSPSEVGAESGEALRGPAEAARFDIAARIQRVTEPGDGTIEVLRVRFTNLGPEPAPPFRYTLYRQALAAVPEERGGAVAGPDSVPTLAPQQHVDHRYRLPLARGTSNVFRIGYSPDLRDRNAANHQVEYRLSVP